MKTALSSSFALFLLALSFCGCSQRSSKPGITVGEKSLFISNMTPDCVIQVVNGKKITRHDFDVMQAFYGKFYRLCNGIPLVGPSAEADGYVHSREQMTPEELFRRTLMRQEARRLGIVPSAATLGLVTRATLQAARRPESTLDAVAKEIGGEEGKLFLQIVQDDARDQTLRESLATNGLSVTEAEIDEGLERVADFNRRADASNAVQRAALDRAAAEAKAGGDFAALGTKYSKVHPEQGKDWCSLELGEIPPDSSALKKWLPTAKVGDVSGPFDWDDGVSIAKLLEKGKGGAPEGVERPDVYHLARITVLAFEHSPEMTRDEVRQELFKYKNEQIQKELGTRLFNAAVIEYPNGTNLFPAVSSEAQAPAAVPPPLQ